MGKKYRLPSLVWEKLHGGKLEFPIWGGESLRILQNSSPGWKKKGEGKQKNAFVIFGPVKHLLTGEGQKFKFFRFLK